MRGLMGGRGELGRALRRLFGAGVACVVLGPAVQWVFQIRPGPQGVMAGLAMGLGQAGFFLGGALITASLTGMVLNAVAATWLPRVVAAVAAPPRDDPVGAGSTDAPIVGDPAAGARVGDGGPTVPAPPGGRADDRMWMPPDRGRG